MAMGFRKKSLIKSFNHSLPQSQPGRNRIGIVSLSYDIVKAHGGEIRVESKEGEGSEFIIMLPIV